MNIILKSSRWLYGIMLAGSLAFAASGFILLVLPPSKNQSATRQHLSAWG